MLFSFYMKYTWKKCYKNIFGCIFLGAYTIQTVPKYIWMGHCIFNDSVAAISSNLGVDTYFVGVTLDFPISKLLWI